MKRLRPFFSYYGSKWRLAPKYPAPRYGHIIEPFAGSAQYATLYYNRQVTLCDANPVVCGVWDYLIRASPQEIMALPSEGYHIDDFPNLPQEAKWLIGFWLNGGCESPKYTLSKWGRQSAFKTANFWGPLCQSRVASQCGLIKHWQIVNCDYRDLANPYATWFVDPPYNNDAGSRYPYQNGCYRELAQWCLSRQGQIIVCENGGASWLPFNGLSQHQSNTAEFKVEAYYHAIQTNSLDG